VGAEDQLAEGWRKVEKRSLYASAGDYTALVQQVLSIAPRTVTADSLLLGSSGMCLLDLNI
jgi:hypothetical protein